MFLPVACSQCGKPFQVPEAAMGKPTACPWCQAAVLALPVGSQVPGDSSALTAPGPATQNAPHDQKKSQEEQPLPLPEPLSLDDEPSTKPNETPPVKRRRSRLSWIAAVLLGTLLMVATTTLTLLILQHKQGRLVSMEWQPFTAPDGSFGIDLPGKATEADSDPEQGERRYVSEGWYSGTTAWIGWRPLTPAQVQEAASKEGWVQYRKFFFDKEQERLKHKYNGYIARDATIEQNPITVEERLDSQNGAVIERMIVMPNGPRPRIYFIGMAGKRLDLDGPVVKKFFESFQVHD